MRHCITAVYCTVYHAWLVKYRKSTRRKIKTCNACHVFCSELIFLLDGYTKNKGLICARNMFSGCWPGLWSVLCDFLFKWKLRSGKNEVRIMWGSRSSKQAEPPDHSRHTRLQPLLTVFCSLKLLNLFMATVALCLSWSCCQCVQRLLTETFNLASPCVALLPASAAVFTPLYFSSLFSASCWLNFLSLVYLYFGCGLWNLASDGMGLFLCIKRCLSLPPLNFEFTVCQKFSC